MKITESVDEVKCPKCGSKNIHDDDFWDDETHYIQPTCHDCGEMI